MWLIDIFAKRKYKRFFNAATLTYLGDATYLSLTNDEQKKVDAFTSKMLLKSSTPSTAFSLFKYPAGKAQARAMAMAQMGIPPIGTGLAWKTFFHFSWIFPQMDMFNHFNPSAKATMEAIAFLRAHDVAVADDRLS